MALFRPAIDALSAYEPGEQPGGEVEVIKLNTNENPFPPSPRAMDVLGAIEADQLRRYPDPSATEFRTCAADVLDVPSDWVLVGNGSDDILTMLLRSVADRDRSVAYAVPTYSLYRTLAEIQGAPVVEVPFDEDFTLPVDALVGARGALTLVASPNSPSGNQTPNAVLRDLATRVSGVLAIDEAYVDFANGSALELTQLDNVIVLRTLSKSHSLAGLRLGFAVASPRLLAGLAKVKDSYNVDAVAARVGAASYRDVAYARETTARVCAARDQLATSLDALGFHVWPSDANFLLVRPPSGKARQLYEALKARGILVRYFDTPRLDDKLRITVGTESQNERLLDALSRV